MTKIVIKSVFGKVHYEVKGEKITIKDAVEDAVFAGINLSYANLSEANLKGANLSCGTFAHANFMAANITYANLNGANFYGANFAYAELTGTSLKGANIFGADLYDAVNIYLPLACPSHGAFTAWKKVKGYNHDYLVKLEVPADAKRISACTNKCRCDKAKVLEITNIDSGTSVNEVINRVYCPTLYKVGEMVYPDSFDEDRWAECSHGIHFFINKDDALNYNI